MNSIDQKRETYAKWFKVGLVAIGALIISPVIFMVVQGLIGAILAGVIGLVAVNAAPYVSMKLANWKVKSVVMEAKENPIETMTNLLIAKKKAFNQFSDDVTAAVAAKNMFAEKCKKFSMQYPARAPEFNAQLDSMTKMIDQKKAALTAAKAAIALGESKLDEMRAYYEMATAAIEANKSAKMDTGDIYEKLKLDTSCDAVFNSMSTAFAQMEVAASLVDQPELIENNPSISVNVITAKTKIVV